MKSFKLFILPSLILLSMTAICQNINMEVKAFAQGFYIDSIATMVPVADQINHPDLCDTVFISLIDSATSQTIYCSKTTISIHGIATTALPAFVYFNKYLVALRFRNTFNVTSLNQVSFDSTSISIDLSAPANLCCSFYESQGIAMAYSGDVNNDGAIDYSDLNFIYNDNNIFASGYLSTDLNGDHEVNATDMVIIYNNLNLFLFDQYVNSCSNTGIGAIEQTDSFPFVYPNPFSGRISIKFPRSQINVSIKIVDSQGQTQFFNSFSQQEIIDLDLPNFNAGIYFALIRTNERFSQIKLIVY